MQSQTIVIKIGTSSLTRPDSGDLHLSAIAKLVEAVVHLRRLGHRVVLVSSGAVGVGCARLGMTERPRHISMKQAVAAVGQSRLMRIYDDFFATLNQPVAQVLLTRANLMQRQHYINVNATFQELLALDVVPIVNENDTVAVDELKFGDNDTLSALVASLIEANWLFLLTDVDRLYSADPRQNPDAKPIIAVGHDQINNLDVDAGAGSQWGTGGMITKLTAARIASAAGVRTAITKGDAPERILEIMQGEPLGTQFAPQPRAVNGMVPTGKMLLDDGAVRALAKLGRSLLPAGICAVEGEFDAQEAVSLCDGSGKEFARGITNYSSKETAQILGCKSDDIARLLGFQTADFTGEDTVIHRDNLVLLDQQNS
jgi:glutamate 5-kinase